MTTGRANLRKTASGTADNVIRQLASGVSVKALEGKTYAGQELLWQGDWEYLTSCDSYSVGKVVFFCEKAPTRDFVDNGSWIAVPRSVFARGRCGQRARVCKGEKCILAKVVERSVTQSSWEGSSAVMKTLGVTVRFERTSSGKVNCSLSYGDAQNVSISLEN